MLENTAKNTTGFPSPAEDYIANDLDLNLYLIKDQAVTFFVRAKNSTWVDFEIYKDDILIVNRSIVPEKNKLILAIEGQEFIIKKFTSLD